MGVSNDEFYIDKDGWTQRKPISDKMCILKCLENCRYLAGLDRHQVERLIKEYGGKIL